MVPVPPREPLRATVPEAATTVPVLAPVASPMPTVPLAPTPPTEPLATAVVVPLADVPDAPTPTVRSPDEEPPTLPPEPGIPEYDPPPQSTSEKGTAATSGANHISQPWFIFTGSPK
jgi:hypothetical protein